MFQISRANQNTHFMFNNFFFFENRAVYEIMWKNIVVRSRPQTTVWHIRVACWKTKATNTNTNTHTNTDTGCLMLFAFPLQQYFTNAPQCMVTVYCLSCHIFPSTRRSSKRPLYFMLPHHNPVCTSPLSHLPLIPPLSPFFICSSK